ncbi:histidine kinase dimerization/phosphoacceptor domain -containing protein [Williamwhitmania taraxaci]|uniref:Two-component sensor histidine kinase, contains HisKA and HATPase domains n=1 Tax=Williamwhitmania taraxaci TaxID=1640674 RepID=A0A1G6P4I0_9BACT|nr:histidine kinase dimerization/phosphoacceptor domain -containing protein [Williamwhitmania taraxaci]SDC74888.1 Two-component sensor histidine kinase, contains HisKA and HATPase domains [Williamwhitmania taraxaci]
MSVRKYVNRYLLLLGIVLIPTTTFSQNILDIRSHNQITEGIPLEDYLSVYEDVEDTTNLTTLLHNPDLFNPLLGFKGKNPVSKYYLKFTISNKTSEQIDLALTFKNLTYVELYILDGNRIVKHKLSGTFQKADSINFTDSRTHFELMFGANTTTNILLVVKHTKHHMPPLNFVVREMQSHLKAKYTKQIYDFFILGAFFIFIILSILSFAFTRNKHYLWLTIYSLGMTSYGFLLNGYMLDAVFPNHAPIVWSIIAFLPNISSIGIILLIKDFFKLKTVTPFLNILLTWLVGSIIIQAFVSYSIIVIYSNYLFASKINVLWFSFQNIIVLVVAFKVWRNLHLPQRIFAIAAIAHAGLFIGGATLFFLLRERSNQILSIINDLGGVFVISFSTIAVAEQMRSSETEKYHALKSMDELRLKQNQFLEETVTIRTQELIIANSSLNEQKIELQNRNEKIEILLKEIHHRVKNNLQLISSLLELHLKKDSDDKLVSIIADGQNRVKAMSLIHQMLFQDENLAIISMEDYIYKLLEQVKTTYTSPRATEVIVDCHGIQFDLDTAIPLGLIINELVTNAFKYALYFSEYPKLSITLQKQTNEDYVLAVYDNGPGLPTNFDFQNNEGIGLHIIPRLCKQLHGSFSNSFNQGTTFTVTFKDTLTRKLTL